MLLRRVSPRKGQTCRPGITQLVPVCPLLLNMLELLLTLAPSAEQSPASELIRHPKIHKRYGKSLSQQREESFKAADMQLTVGAGDFKRKKGNQMELEDWS